VSDHRVILDFAVGLQRLDRVIAELAFTKGLSIVSAIALDSPAFDGAPIRYRISLQNGTAQAVVYLDHEALIDAEECFVVLTLPQLDAAMSRLAHSAKQSIG
jgi:hypothetical protein